MISSTLAYLDPGSSSVFIQVLAGGVAAIGVTAKLFWNRILRFFGIRRDEPAPGAERASADAQPLPLVGVVAVRGALGRQHAVVRAEEPVVDVAQRVHGVGRLGRAHAAGRPEATGRAGP